MTPKRNPKRANRATPTSPAGGDVEYDGSDVYMDDCQEDLGKVELPCLACGANLELEFSCYTACACGMMNGLDLDTNDVGFEPAHMLTKSIEEDEEGFTVLWQVCYTPVDEVVFKELGDDVKRAFDLCMNMVLGKKRGDDDVAHGPLIDEMVALDRDVTMTEINMLSARYTLASFLQQFLAKRDDGS